MFSNVKWISNLTFIGLSVVTFTSTLSAQQARIGTPQQSLSLLAADEARDLFNAGQRSYDESRYPEAENKFREVVQRFPKNAIADRADYWLIRTLMQQAGKKTEALDRINAFATRYPKSRWIDDIQEKKIELTNQVPPRAEAILFRQGPPAPPPAPPAPPAGPFGPGTPTPFGAIDREAIAQANAASAYASAAAAAVRPAVIARKANPFQLSLGEPQSTDPELSLRQEVLRAVFRNNADRAIEIESDLLKSNPADPLVLSTLNMLATSQSARALPMLLEIAKNSMNPRARKDAIFWISQSRGDKDSVVDMLTGLLPAGNADDSEAVTFALGQVRTDKAINALATIARDKNRTEGERNSALLWIGQSRAPNRLSLLEDIYKNTSDSLSIRRQVLFALGQTHDPQAVSILSNIASNDPSIELRKQAVFSLGQIKSAEATQALENLLQKK